MHIETERKFLVCGEKYKLLATSCLHMEQGYICRSEGRTVRVRTSGEKAWLTIKGPSSSGLSRLEWEKEIPVEEAKDLMQLCTGGIIIKDRYIIPATTTFPAGAGQTETKRPHSTDQHNGRFFEVDEFFGKNEGLTVAEIELGSEKEELVAPEWLGKEVTGDPRYYNSELTRHPFTEW